MRQRAFGVNWEQFRDIWLAKILDILRLVSVHLNDLIFQDLSHFGPIWPTLVLNVTYLKQGYTNYFLLDHKLFMVFYYEGGRLFEVVQWQSADIRRYYYLSHISLLILNKPKSSLKISEKMLLIGTMQMICNRAFPLLKWRLDL